MEKVIRFLKENININETVIVSCSAGPDSMCLLSIIKNIRDEKNLNIICAHINHNIREESIEEEQYITKYCQENNIQLEVKHLNEFEDNFQNDARKKRYHFLESVQKKYNATTILTAHHGDDLIETILMRITRGSNLTGYGGFKVINNLSTYKTMKPLIYVSKKDIIKYNEENQIKYYIDESNYSDKYTRNRYRNKILPILKEESENVHAKYLQFSEKLDEYEKFVNNYIAKVRIITDLNEIDIDIYNNESDFIKDKAIEMLIKNIQKENEFHVTDNISFEIKKLINSQNGKGQIDMPNNFKGYKEKRKFYIKKI